MTMEIDLGYPMVLSLWTPLEAKPKLGASRDGAKHNTSLLVSQKDYLATMWNT